MKIIENKRPDTECEKGEKKKEKMKPIYEPKGRAKEYGDYALNIFTGCPHKCFYCFAPNTLKKERDTFHSNVNPRKDIVNEVRKQIEKENIKGKLIHLCFICDPYPKGYEELHHITREIIKIIKDSGNHVQILTKNGIAAMKDFDLLDENDWFGITYAGYTGPVSDSAFIPEEEPNSGSPVERLQALFLAHEKGIKTWISCEPVLNAEDVLSLICKANYIDKWKIGKLNYFNSDINWKKFGKTAEILLKAKAKESEIEFYLKDDLRKEMEKN